MATISGDPGATLPNNRPPISDPRELRERNVSTASRSSWSITASGIETATGFWGGDQIKAGAGAESAAKRDARAVESFIQCLPDSPTILLEFSRISYGFLPSFPK